MDLWIVLWHWLTEGEDGDGETGSHIDPNG